MLVATLLSGCSLKSNTAETLPTISVAEREAMLKAFLPWRALGSIAVDSEEEGKFNASFAWDGNNSGFDIKLFGPLGVQAIHLSQNEEGAQITDRNGTVNGEDAQLLLTEVLGSAVPINQLQHWAVGLSGEATVLERDDVGRIDAMTVAGNQGAVNDGEGWQIDYKRYTIFESMYLPKTVRIESEGVTISLNFKKWSRGEIADNDRLSIPGVGS